MVFKSHLNLRVLVATALTLTACVAFADDPQSPSPEGVAFFESQVKPILQKQCFKCHGGGDSIKGGLRLTSRVGLLKGGDTGPAASLQTPGDSLLLEAINYESYEAPRQHAFAGVFGKGEL